MTGKVSVASRPSLPTTSSRKVYTPFKPARFHGANSSNPTFQFAKFPALICESVPLLGKVRGVLDSVIVFHVVGFSPAPYATVYDLKLLPYASPKIGTS